ncbi:DUF2062 domain-containing protein [Oricola sp.]|uniref:DUF2062 domain-containing protein n=1 Tax=Oricola sp. TaxID=1979950 RepID=UPI0025F9AE89|nr:DUF2062 domain-containing protein [Oricola sp.]MCI5077419.1 DUF2062 domain-containing protein [Oricola sp.]
MIFARRERENWGNRFRVWLLPRRNYARSFRYYWKRMLRIKATPHAIAAGVAAGAFASFTPFMGFHFILAFVLAWLLAGNMIAAALGTAVGNPLTFPAIWAATHGAGTAILGAAATSNPSSVHIGSLLRKGEVMAIWDPLLKPMLVGGVPLGLAVGGFLYVLTRFAVAAFQHRRRTHFETFRPAAENPELGA